MYSTKKVEELIIVSCEGMISREKRLGRAALSIIVYDSPRYRQQAVSASYYFVAV